MPTKRIFRMRQRQPGNELTPWARRVLRIGLDLLGDFRGEEGRRILEENWSEHGDQLADELREHDDTVRCAGFWWFSPDCPRELRVAYPDVPPDPSEQRMLLIEHNILTGAAKQSAQKKLQDFAEWKRHHPKDSPARYDLCVCNPFREK